MPYRVIQWSTGNVGSRALRAILGHPELELVGVWVHGPSKVGRDAGELAGLPPTGVLATSDADALLALPADCVVYTATADRRPKEAVSDLCRILRAGKSVVSSSVVGLVHPHTLNAGWARELDDACRAGQSSFFTSGIDPGFANDVLPLVLSGLCEHWTSIRIQEIVNYSTYDQPQVLFDVLGFGQPLDAAPLICAPGVVSFAWGGTLRLLAEGIGVALDEIREVHERRRAAQPFVVLGRRIERGTQAAVCFEVQGIVAGEAALIVEHVTRLRDADAPDWAQGAGSYRVTIEGVPRMVCDLAMADEHGDHARGGVVLTATRLVNAIPAVCQARPGLLSALDLPLVTGRGLRRNSVS